MGGEPRGYNLFPDTPSQPNLSSILQTYQSLNSNMVHHYNLPSRWAKEEVDDFMMYVYKVRRCLRTQSHDWMGCPFAHRGEKARRRDPRKFPYHGMVCPEFKDTGECRKGQNCEHAHGVFELWLHPSRYRTRVCEAGFACVRPICFFAHTPEQLRPEVIHNCFCRDLYGHAAKSPFKVAEGSEVPTPSSSLLPPSPSTAASSNSRTNEIEAGEEEYDAPNIEWILELVDE